VRYTFEILLLVMWKSLLFCFIYFPLVHSLSLIKIDGYLYYFGLTLQNQVQVMLLSSTGKKHRSLGELLLISFCFCFYFYFFLSLLTKDYMAIFNYLMIVCLRYFTYFLLVACFDYVKCTLEVQLRFTSLLTILSHNF
jgi:hypothetical protein